MSFRLQRLAIAVMLPCAAFATGWGLASRRPAVPAVIEQPSVAVERPAVATRAPGDVAPEPESVARLAASDPPRAATLVAALQDHQSAGATLAAAAHWAASDPAAAMAWIDSLPPSDLAQKASDLALCVWCDVDPPRAIAYFTSLSTEAQRRIVAERLDQFAFLFDAATGWPRETTHGMHTIGDAILRRVPGALSESILKAMETSGVEHLRKSATRKRAEAIFADDKDAGLLFAKENGMGDWLLAAMAREDPEGALALAQEHTFSAKGIVYQWAATDPEAARAAVANIETSQGRAAALDGWRDQMLASGKPELVARSYSDPDDSGKTGRYNRDFRRSSRLTKSFEAWFLLDPEAATTQAATLSNKTDRKDVLFSLHQRLKQQGGADPKARLVELGFSPQEVADLR